MAMTVTLHHGDLPDNLTFTGAVAIDTETMGLNPLRDRLCLVQLSSGDGNAHLVKFAPDLEKNGYNAPNLSRLLADPAITKIFHFARFDIAVLQKYLGVITTPIYCTKIAAKLARTYSDRHGLKELCREMLGVELNKASQSSDWGQDNLSQDQQNYAAQDVLYLHRLRDKLNAMLKREGRDGWLQEALDFLPTRAALDLAGWENNDLFSHA